MGYSRDLQQVVEPGTTEHANLGKFLRDYGRKLPPYEVAVISERYNDEWECGDHCCSGGGDFTIKVDYPSCEDGPFENTVWESIDSILEGAEDE